MRKVDQAVVRTLLWSMHRAHRTGKLAKLDRVQVVSILKAALGAPSTGAALKVPVLPTGKIEPAPLLLKVRLQRPPPAPTSFPEAVTSAVRTGVASGALGGTGWVRNES